MRAILTYHSIDDSGSPISVAPAEFQRHVEFLVSGKVRVVPLAQIQATRDEHAVAITFDDGLANFASEAWPRLREHALPATLFVVSGHVGRDNAWQGLRDSRVPHLQLLDWDSLGRLATEGLDLGGHSRTHPHLEQVPEPQLADEIEGCAQDLVRWTGRRPESFCYPFGTFGPLAEQRVAAAYRRACTTVLGALSGDEPAHLLPRLDAYYLRGRGRLEAWGSLRFAARIRVLRAARALRGALGK